MSFTGAGGVVLHGTVLAPASGTTGRPAMVMLQGAGNRDVQELRPAAEAFARRGIVTLLYSKRTVGYSLFHRDYGVLADDALAGLQLLRSRPDVDRARLGLWAQSEGAFVAPLAANRSTDVKFLITVGAAMMTPATQSSWNLGQRLRHADVSGSMVRALEVTSVRWTVEAGLFPEAGFDPFPAWERVDVPVLAQWGELDRAVPPADSGRLIRQALDRGANSHYTIRFVPAVAHNLHATDDDGFDRIVDLPAGYGDYEASWVEALAGGPPPGTSVGPAPTQSAPAVDLSPSPWHVFLAAHPVVLMVILLGLAAYPVTAAARRVGGARGAPPTRGPARLLAATGLVATPGSLLYVLFVLASGGNLIGPVVLGRPVPWLALQCLAVVTVLATAATAVAWRRHRRDLGRVEHVRLALLVAGGLAFLPWAVVWGLVVP
ncbi:alpha/beta hydrolase family protein [Pseudonocardia lacus]|uniref:alpha/beta hydrolase family protein n=1 Tax=Pseudonocardia lacus TaxID=2835865 RepID=UPI001BDC14A3|nr:alpha/beta hydrolase [Pseudonocardia lacus]